MGNFVTLYVTKPFKGGYHSIILDSILHNKVTSLAVIVPLFATKFFSLKSHLQVNVLTTQ